MIVGGLDVGSTGCKLTLYSTDGTYIDSSYMEYDIVRKNGQHEIDAAVIYDSVCTVIKNCTKKHSGIAGIGVTSFGESFVMLDENDKPLLPIMLYTDPRGKEECAELCDKLGADTLMQITGMKPHEMYSLPKLLWIKKNLPEAYAKVKRILLISDYIAYMLTGIAQTDYSLATRTMAFDIRQGCFSKTILDAAGVSAGLFSKPARTGDIIGNVCKKAADELFLSEDTVVITGCQDQIAAAIGAGALATGEAVDGSGTVECITPIFDGIPESDAYYAGGYPVIPFATEGKYACYAYSFTGGAALKWYRDTFASDLGEKVYQILDGGIKDEPTGILVMPHFAGGATPYMDNGSKAAVIGLTLEHTSLDIYKAIMEGVAYEMRLNLETINSHGIRPKLLYATGGGAKSSKWLQIKADVLGIPLVQIDAKEVGAQGICMMLCVALGVYSDLEKAKSVFVKMGKTYYPDAKRKEIYDKYYAAYADIYSSVRPIVKKIGE